MFRVTQIALIFAVLISTFAVQADNRPIYEMNHMVTWLWDKDVEYYSMPIRLKRTADTTWLHRLTFNVNSYRKYCTQWENRCVAYDQKGNCTRWERVCVGWGHDITQVEKRIELNFRDAPALGANEVEEYEVTIQRMKPFDEGEDSVSTWFRDEKTMKPVRVRKNGTYNYFIEEKKP
jgi:hypothetical protein